MRAIFLPVSKSLMHSILDSNGKTVVGRNNFTDLTQGLTNRRTGGYHTTVSKIGMSIARIFVCGGVRLMWILVSNILFKIHSIPTRFRFTVKSTIISTFS